ncbi:MAG: hypothetical protein WC615_01510 [Mucilaginibacter sp.]|jgi:hypothetical protein|uniref:hypothetical protein n=1 Tax=Mucilaginibacter sp. TaxID=1882438 RepID=UPI003565BFDC
MAHITFDLQNSSNPRSFSEDNLVHQYEFKKISNYIDEQLILADTDNNAAVRMHETISVLGSRGSGKTSFLESLMSKYQTSIKAEVLPMIDPTLIEEKGHVFLDIISRIDQKVEEKLFKKNNGFTFDSDNEKEGWDALMRKLADGLPMLDGLGGTMTEQSWQDAEYIMDSGKRSVMAAINLEKNFHLLITEALTILERNAFIIVFDDIDIDFLKGWRVLETIRKYFTTPKIITIISGDLKLFSLEIRKQQWKNFGKALLKNEGEALDKIADFNDIVTVMEGQYMQKVMKSERRIHLMSLAEKLKQEGEGYFRLIPNKTLSKQSITLEQYYTDILKRYGVNNAFQADTYITFILGLPLRTQIQFMRLYQAFDSVVNPYPVNILDPFLNDLYELRVDTTLVSSTPKLLSVVILKLLLSKRVLNEAYQLQPTTTDTSLNSSLTALAFSFADASRKSRGLFFDYFIKIGYVRNLHGTFGYLEDNLNSIQSDTSPSIEGLIKYAGLQQDRVLRDVVGDITAYFRGYLDMDRDNRQPWGGTIILPGLATNAKQQRNEIEDRIDFVFRDSSADEQTLAFIPLSINRYSTKNTTVLSYSIFGLLGTIGELLKESIFIPVALSELSQIRSYTMPDFIKRIIVEGEVGNTVNLDFRTFEHDSVFDDLPWSVIKWKEEFENVDLVFAPYLIGKIVTRFFYALANTQNFGNYASLGQMFHDQIVTFMNAVLIEESREIVGINIKLNLNNTNFSDQVFVDNLNAANRIGPQKFPVAQWLFTCPLLTAYLKPNLLESISLFNGRLYSAKTHINIFDQLCNVSTWGNTVKNENLQPMPTGRDFAGKYRALSKRKLPFNWFTFDTSMSSATKNKNIRINAKDIFGEDNLSSAYLRDFRKYLKKLNINSWSQKIS